MSLIFFKMETQNGLSNEDLEILNILVYNPRTTPRNIASQLKIDEKGVMRTIMRLEECNVFEPKIKVDLRKLNYTLKIIQVYKLKDEYFKKACEDVEKLKEEYNYFCTEVHLSAENEIIIISYWHDLMEFAQKNLQIKSKYFVGGIEDEKVYYSYWV